MSSRYSPVHWFTIFLDYRIYKYFDIIHYDTHNYLLYSKEKTKVFCAFLIVRTSKYCFRLMIYHKDRELVYYSFKSARITAQFVNSYYYNIFLKDINNNIC